MIPRNVLGDGNELDIFNDKTESELEQINKYKQSCKNEAKEVTTFPLYITIKDEINRLINNEGNQFLP